MGSGVSSDANTSKVNAGMKEMSIVITNKPATIFLKRFLTISASNISLRILLTARLFTYINCPNRQRILHCTDDPASKDCIDAQVPAASGKPQQSYYVMPFP